MAKSWTVRAKRQMNSTIPAGFTIRVTTQGNNPDYYELEQALRKAGVDMRGAVSATAGGTGFNVCQVFPTVETAAGCDGCSTFAV